MQHAAKTEFIKRTNALCHTFETFVLFFVGSALDRPALLNRSIARHVAAAAFSTPANAVPHLFKTNAPFCVGCVFQCTGTLGKKARMRKWATAVRMQQASTWEST